jgi:DNA-binding transcriptional regulator YdaS (Cro superfamily)
MSLSLLKYCEHVGTTVAAVARKAGLDEKGLYKIAKGERGFTPETAAAIEQATAGVVTPSDLNKVRMEWRAKHGDKPQKKSPALAEEAA